MSHENKALDYRTLSLAGVFQTASLVKQLATTGNINKLYLSASLKSLFILNASNAVEIYENPLNLTLGLNALIDFYEPPARQLPDRQIAHYAFSLLHLERTLTKNPEKLKIIKIGLERTQSQMLHYPLLHENIMASLASIYLDTLSTFRFRIHVIGEPLYLNRPLSINTIRALLLAGIRSAVLWRQLKGNQLQLLFARKAMVNAAKAWLKGNP
ncbi:MAG: protein belonging to uncharacterized protein family [Francisellaceae bacterium]|nr:protein belonging to uncharacterized protein family [Francisellaceae bacterium]